MKMLALFVFGIFFSLAAFAQDQLNFTIPLCPPSSITEYDQPLELRVSPNPTIGDVYLDMSSSGTKISGYKIEVFNTLGTLILLMDNLEGARVQLATRDFETGIYLVRLSDGHRSSNQRIIKQ
ncbi:MAG TPA: hypothetical protein DCS15_08865 [Flavobacteriales bacterium]|jgi:hypothetical protein|nr:hypothetical protein [Flavobacteriales bacterium]